MTKSSDNLVSLLDWKKHAGKRILVVEDDFSIEAIFDALIHGIDPTIQMEWVSNARAAYQKLKRATRLYGEDPFSLVITDVFLDGEMTGIDLWEVCKEEFPSMPVLMMSGTSTHRFLELMKSQKVTAPFIQKPLEVGATKKLIENALAHSEATPT